MCDGYTIAPDKYRICQDAGNKYPWQVDATGPCAEPEDCAHAAVHYTQDVSNRATWDEALLHITSGEFAGRLPRSEADSLIAATDPRH